MRICTVCGEGKPATPEFFDYNGGAGKANRTLRKYCRECRRLRAMAARHAAGAKPQIKRVDKDGHRECVRCKTFKPLTAEYFSVEYKDGSLSGICKPCRLEIARKSRKRPIAQAIILWHGYNRSDERAGRICSITPEWLLENVMSKPCSYCGDVEQVGADRIDNNKGHTPDNIVPACGGCNVARGDRYTVEEMKIIGRAIAEVKKQRLGSTARPGR